MKFELISWAIYEIIWLVFWIWVVFFGGSKKLIVHAFFMPFRLSDLNFKTASDVIKIIGFISILGGLGLLFFGLMDPSIRRDY